MLQNVRDRPSDRPAKSRTILIYTPGYRYPGTQQKEKKKRKKCEDSSVLAFGVHPPLTMHAPKIISKTQHLRVEIKWYGKRR